MTPSKLRGLGGALLFGALVSLAGCDEKRVSEKPGPQGWVTTTEPAAALPVPFVVDDHFHPSNCFDGGACETVKFNPKGCDGPDGLERPEAAQGQCYGFVYEPNGPGGFGGIFFVHDSFGESNWGEEEGRPIEAGAKKVSFFAAAPRGPAPRVYFKVGGIDDANNPYRDKLKLEQPIVLGTEFQKYEISLEGQSYDKVISAFGWAMLGQDGIGSFKFFVDDMRWE